MAWPTLGQRRMWARSLRDTATVTHTPLVDDGAGSYEPGTPTTATYACRVQPDTTTPREAVQGGGVVATDYWNIQLPDDAAVEAADTITVAGTVYQVQSATTGRSNRYGITARCTRGQ